MDLIKRLASIEDLPTIPTALHRILVIAQDVNADFTDLVGVIETDQALAAKVLKVANSPVYGLPRNVSDLERAVSLLGFREVKQIALGLKAFESMFATSGRTTFERRKFWTHCYATAFVNRFIAKPLGFKENDFAFVAGLLHDIGKVITDRYFPKLFAFVLEKMESEGCDFLTAEEAVITTGHDVIGGFLVGRWNLPDSLVAAVAGHHRPEEQTHPLADLTFVANKLVHVLGLHSLGVERTIEMQEVLEDPHIGHVLSKTGSDMQALEEVAKALMEQQESFLEQISLLV